MHLAGKVKRRLVDEINITPLTDVFLVLLIIMMVMAPMMKMTRMEIRPPEVDKGAALDPSKLAIEVTKEGVYYVDGKETAPGELANVLRAAAKDPPETRGLTLQGDKESLSKYAVAVFTAAREAEYSAVTLAVGVKSVTPAAAPAAETGTP
jgi:biopolymer transport protein ExbD/biopolymer transport protein TolR